ncbi:MAG: 30S ribosomal protein S17e [Nitrososphaerota archaeon]|nr:30S ribosomal protein S17e [Nitrososphaerota archaeon]
MFIRVFIDSPHGLGKVYDGKIKGVAKMLLEKYGDKFSDDYYANKEFLKKIAIFKSKKLLNRIAGYITSIKSSTKRREEEVIEAGRE